MLEKQIHCSYKNVRFLYPYFYLKSELRNKQTNKNSHKKYEGMSRTFPK